jgi:hypothetical protein
LTVNECYFDYYAGGSMSRAIDQFLKLAFTSPSGITDPSPASVPAEVPPRNKNSTPLMGLVMGDAASSAGDPEGTMDLPAGPRESGDQSGTALATNSAEVKISAFTRYVLEHFHNKNAAR